MKFFIGQTIAIEQMVFTGAGTAYKRDAFYKVVHVNSLAKILSVETLDNRRSFDIQQTDAKILSVDFPLIIKMA